MVKAFQVAYNGMNRDVAKSKHPQEFYWDAMNIRITADESQSTAVLTNERGNELAVTLPAVSINTTTRTISYNNGKTKINYNSNNGLNDQVTAGDLPTSSGTHQIIGWTKTRDSIILASTDDNGFDCLWEITGILNETEQANLLYVRNMGFSTSKPVQLEFNYENNNIQKIYWVDGEEQVRSLNIKHESIEGNGTIINIALESLDIVGTVSFSQPVITEIQTGGSHTAGMIQYAYNLYRLNSSQTKISPLSEIKPLGKVNGGGEVNEIVGATPVVQIDNIDTSYDSIKVYAIKYTSYNQAPSVSLIADREINPDRGSITIYDDGDNIASVGLDEFIFLGSDPITPQHIKAKDNRMFFFNIKKKNFTLPDELDCRAYAFSSARQYTILDDVGLSGENPTGIEFTRNWNDSFPYNVNFKHDAVNKNYDIYKFQSDGTTRGGEGKYLKYEIVQKSLADSEDYRVLKDREVYRIAIRFFNNRGQTSLPRWIADFQTPTGNLEGNYNTLNVTLNADFKTWLDTYAFESEDLKPVGFQILRSQRLDADKTIVAQGLLSTMMVNSIRNSPEARLFDEGATTLGGYVAKKADSDNQVKLPNILVRTAAQTAEPLQAAAHLEGMQGADNVVGDHENSTDNPLTEIAYDLGKRKADTYQYTAMYQMYSPEIHFGNPSFTDNMKLNFIGAVENTDNAYWGQERRISNKVKLIEGKVTGGLHPSDVTTSGISRNPITGNINFLMNRGIIGDPNGSEASERVAFNQFYREFTTFRATSSSLTKDIYGSPEIAERGQGRTLYNNKSKYEYSNSLEGFLSDGEGNFNTQNPNERAIVNINSYGAKNATFVLGAQDDAIQSYNRPRWESLYSSMSVGNNNGCIIGEITKPNGFKYTAIYGGTNYEAKRRTSYLAIGDYVPLTSASEHSVQIDSPGDTFVQNFKFARIAKTDTESYSVGTLQYTEIVSFPVETVVDLKNRNDISVNAWDGVFQPRYEEYHEYNRVYSQEADLIKETNLDYNLKPVTEFDTRIQSSKVKVPNELVDSWTDLEENEVMDLDGAYGPINGIVNYRDTIYTLQEDAVALISINPRVTISASDGIPTELGTGNVLNDYNYLTTKSGTINKWSIKDTETGFYYFDLFNRAWMKFSNNSIIDLGDTFGMNSYIKNNIAYNFIVQDNPIIGKGASIGYDPSTNTVYLTLRQTGTDYTLSFNEKLNSFISFHSYTPSLYINKGANLFTTNPTNNQIWLHNTEDVEYNKYYGTRQDFYVTFEVNPQDRDCVFNNLEYKGECYSATGIDQPVTFSHIKAYNEYLDTGSVQLTSDTLQRKFRNWRIQIPRDSSNNMDRMRGHWVKVKLSYENDFNYQMIIHNIIFYYTAYSY